MNKIVVKILVLIGLIIILTTSLIVINHGRKDVRCRSINVTYSEDYQFVSEKRIKEIVLNGVPKLYRSKLRNVDTEWLETKIEEHPWVEQAEIFKGYGLNDSLKFTGILNVNIKQKVPILRVMNGGDGFYLSEDGDKMPLSSLYTPKLIVVTGHVDMKYLKTQVVEFIKFINDNKFWKAQIQQIHIRGDNNLVLVPRIGNHLILFGKAENLELKFRNLKAVYENGFSKYGTWNKYKYVSLKYDNQVICTLR